MAKTKEATELDPELLLEMDKYEMQLELLEDILGTVPMNKEVYASYIAAGGAKELKRKAALKNEPHASGQPVTDESVQEMVQEEVETVEDREEKGWTGFHLDPNNRPFIYDYTIRGFLKEAARTIQDQIKTEKFKQPQDRFGRFCFPHPRQIYFTTDDGNQVEKPDGVKERPLRAMTALGPRVTLVRSDYVKSGRRLTVVLKIVKGSGITFETLKKCLAYGQFIGLGQWRTGGYGRFKVISIKEI